MTSHSRSIGGTSARGGADVLFDRVGTTLFYRPVDPGPGEQLWFLHWKKDDPRPRLPLDDMWHDAGTPPAVGTFVFFNLLPPESAAAEVEVALRKVWTTPPVASGFAWVRYRPEKSSTPHARANGSQAPTPTTAAGDPDDDGERAWWWKHSDDNASLVTVATRLALTLDESSRPTVEADTPFTLPPGQRTFGFAGGAIVFGARGDGVSLDGFTVSYPPLTDADPPSERRGLALPMTGAAVGCVCFDALINQGATRAQVEAAKTLVHVQIDPLHPFDPTRTFQTLTGRNYLLRKTADAFQILPAPPGA